jgi:hypothetical protein
VHTWPTEHFHLVLWTRPRLTARIGVRCDRTVAPKGGCLQSWNGSHDLKSLFMRFDLLCPSMLGTSTSSWSNLSILVLPIHLYLLLPLVFLRLDWFSWCFLRLDALALFFIIKVFLALLDWILRYSLFHGFDTLGSHLREGSLDYDGGLVRLQVQTKFDTHRLSTVTQPHFCVINLWCSWLISS